MTLRWLAWATAVVLSTLAGVQSPPPSPDVIWKQPLPQAFLRHIRLRPDGLVYVAGAGNEASLLALRPDGGVAWTWKAHEAKSASAPVFDGSGRVYAAFGDRFACIGADGQLLWQHRFYVRDFLGSATPHVAVVVDADGSSYLAAAYLTAYGPDGSVRWQRRGVFDRPHLDGAGHIEISDARTTYVLSLSGEPVTTMPKATPLAIDPQSLDVRIGAWGTVKGCSDESALVCAYDTAGRPRWAYGPRGRYHPGAALEVASDGTVYVADRDNLVALRDSNHSGNEGSHSPPASH